MKWLTAFLCLLALPSFAEIPQGVLQFPSSMLCGVYNEGAGMDEEYGELPFVTGDAQVMTPDTNKSYHGTIRIFLNPQTQSYTILFDIKDEVTCLLTTGDRLEPIYTGERL